MSPHAHAILLQDEAISCLVVEKGPCSEGHHCDWAQPQQSEPARVAMQQLQGAYQRSSVCGAAQSSCAATHIITHEAAGGG